MQNQTSDSSQLELLGITVPSPEDVGEFCPVAQLALNGPEYRHRTLEEAIKNLPNSGKNTNE